MSYVGMREWPKLHCTLEDAHKPNPHCLRLGHQLLKLPLFAVGEELLHHQPAEYPIVALRLGALQPRGKK